MSGWIIKFFGSTHYPTAQVFKPTQSVYKQSLGPSGSSLILFCHCKQLHKRNPTSISSKWPKNQRKSNISLYRQQSPWDSSLYLMPSLSKARKNGTSLPLFLICGRFINCSWDCCSNNPASEVNNGQPSQFFMYKVMAVMRFGVDIGVIYRLVS